MQPRRRPRHRQIYLIYANHITALKTALNASPHNHNQDQGWGCLWVSSNRLEHRVNAIILPHNKVKTILGREFQCIVYDAQEGFYPDAFGAVAGTLSAAGLFLLLLPAHPPLNRDGRTLSLLGNVY